MLNIAQTGDISPSNLKRTCIHLGDQDRAALAIIRAELGFPTDALSVRLALRFLAKRINESKDLAGDAKEGQDE
jgi:hypothetical protein